MLRALAFCGVAVLFASACSGGDGAPSLTPLTASPSLTANVGTGLPSERVTFYGADAGDQAAAVVTGDFNGDAATDIVLGASLGDGPDNSRSDGGEAYLFLGPFPDGGSLDASGGEYDAIFYGAAAGDTLGRTLAAGDFNGDGIDDLVMAAPAANEQAGAVYMMFGGEWPEQTDFAEADPDVLMRGGAEGDFAGLAMASTDMDGDNVSELIIGALLADGPDGSRADAGAVYVLRGQQLVAGDGVDLGSVSGVVYGARAGDHLGEALATGDFNGDGTSDLILVATFSAGPDGSRPGAGATYVLETPVTLFPFDLAAAAPRLTVFGADEGDQLGHSAGVGDTDGDGDADILLGAVSADGPNNDANLTGEAELIHGGPDRGGIFDSALSAPGAIIFGPEAEARLGRSASVGDLNGDAKAELLISAPNVASRSGQVYVLAGGGDYPRDVFGADITLSGLDEGDILGHESFGTPSLAVAAIAGAERPALLISAPGGDGPDNERIDCGEVYLIRGSLLGI